MSNDAEKKANDLADAIRALGVIFIGRLPSALTSMDDELYSIEKDPHNQSAWKTLHRHLHSMAGSAGTFGHNELGDRARELENRINDMLKSGDVSSDPVRLAFILDQRNFMAWISEQYVNK
jgi:chemotaxis protein histidine kinase CheA